MSRGLSVLVLLLLVPACATGISDDRRAYILAHPHGWVELTIQDTQVPNIPPPEDSKEGPQMPTSCRINVEIDNEDFLWDDAYPKGEQEPYEVESGFRFPVPVGVSELYFSYSGCRVRDGEVESIELAVMLMIAENMVHEIAFDGNALLPMEPRENRKVSMEDLYEAVTGKRSPVD